MRFYDKLNELAEDCNCTAKEICRAAGISEASFSRYRSGERVPDSDSEAFSGLCSGIAEISSKNGKPKTAADVAAELLQCDDVCFLNCEQLRKNFNALAEALNISISRLCKFTNYDSSTVYRIKSGSRRPAEPKKFASAVADFTAVEMSDDSGIAAMALLFDCPAEALAEEKSRKEAVLNWLLTEHDSEDGRVFDFLSKLNEFDLNEYIKAIKFDKLKVITAPFITRGSKFYYGLGEMMESELDFLKATVLSKSTEPVTMFSDMPMAEMAKDPDFPKKWMFGMAMMLKKGLHLNQIHHLERSFEDMMLGLESWIPMYMTGQISPYYFKNNQSGVFMHLLKVSGAAALDGQAISECHESGRYYLTKNKAEVEYYKRLARDMLNAASPLMEIYRADSAEKLKAFVMADSRTPGQRRSVLSTLPLYTMQPELLEKILAKNSVSQGDCKKIKSFAALQRQAVAAVLAANRLVDEVPLVSKQNFESEIRKLPLSGAFYEKDVLYDYDDYAEHLRQTLDFEAAHPNYSLLQTEENAFCNLQIIMNLGHWAMVSKEKSPAIHFVIRHPKLRGAIEKFSPPIVEK